MREHAVALDAGPIPYSTHDLALSVALSFFKRPEYVPQLGPAQLVARLKVLQWLEESLVVGALVKSFEDVLYNLYKPVFVDPSRAAGMNLHNTKFSLGKHSFEIEPLPPTLAGKSGLVPFRVVIDFLVGEEIALYWLDPTPFIKELSVVKPLQLFLRSGLFNSDFGPLMWMLFYVPDPEPLGEQPFSAMECHLNPADPNQVALWRQLARQTHWHLTLIGCGNQVHGFFEFENTYGLDSALDTMESACEGIPMIDFMAAKQEFGNTYTMAELYHMT